MDFTVDIKENASFDSAVKESIDNALFAIGLEAQKGILDFMVEDKIYDTRRLMSSISFITPFRKGVGKANFNSQPYDQLSGVANDGEVIIGSDVEYASSVNFGTSKQRARHFMETGINRSTERMRASAEIALKGGDKK